MSFGCTWACGLSAWVSVLMPALSDTLALYKETKLPASYTTKYQRRNRDHPPPADPLLKHPSLQPLLLSSTAHPSAGS